MRERPLCLLCLLVLAGIWLAQELQLPGFQENPVPSFVQEYLTEHPQNQISGTAAERHQGETSQSVTLKDAHLIIRSKKIPIHNVKLYLTSPDFPKIGSQVLAEAELARVEEPGNPGEFNARSYYAMEDIYYLGWKGKILRTSSSYSARQEHLCRLREHFAALFQKTAGKQAPILNAMLLGDKSSLTSQTKAYYQMAGIIHILAISGLHISMIGMGFYNLCQRAGAGLKLSSVLALFLMLQYGAFTGAGTATMRAVVMFFFRTGASVFGRCYDGGTALAVSALLLAAEHPACIYNSGFLLSFAAVLGIHYFQPVFRQKWLTGVSAQLFTVPVLLFFYGELSLYGILLNLLILPTVGVVLIFGIAGGLAGWFSLIFGSLLLLPARGLLWGYETLARLGCRLPFCTWIAGQPSRIQILLYYLFLFAAVQIWKRYHRHTDSSRRNTARFPNAVKAVSVGIWFLGVCCLGFHPQKGLSITCLDVDQGDAIVLRLPKGACYLTDGGSESKNVGTYKILPYLKSQGISGIEGILVSHTDEDHISGIREILLAQAENTTSVRVKNLYLPLWDVHPEAYRELEVLAEKAKIPVAYLKEGDQIRHQGVQIKVLAPFQEDANTGEDTNAASMVLQISYGKIRGLLTGDIGKDEEQKLSEETEKIQFLKAAHHGSKNSSSPEFLKKASPGFTFISCGKENRYGHPHQETLDRLNHIGTRIYTTAESGALTFWTDGKMIKITSYKQQTGQGILPLS